MKLNPFLTPNTKKYSKWIIDLLVRATLEKLFEEKKVNLHDLGLGNAFLSMTPKAQGTERKIGKWDFIKVKSFCVSKDTTKKVEEQPTQWRKYLQIICYLIRDLYIEYTKNSYNSIIKRPGKKTTLK